MQQLNLHRRDASDVFQKQMISNVISINQKIKDCEEAIIDNWIRCFF